MKTSGWLGLTLSASVCVAALDARAQAPNVSAPAAAPAPGTAVPSAPSPPPAFRPPTGYAPPTGYYPPPYYPPDWPRPFPVLFVGDAPERRFTLSNGEYASPFAYCTGGCNAMLFPGTYWVSVRSTAKTAAGKGKVRLEQPATVLVTAQRADADGRMGTVGFGLLLGGLAAVIWSAADKSHDADWSSGAALLLGLGATVTGLTLVITAGATGATGEPEIKVERMPER